MCSRPPAPSAAGPDRRSTRRTRVASESRTARRRRASSSPGSLCGPWTVRHPPAGVSRHSAWGCTSFEASPVPFLGRSEAGYPISRIGVISGGQVNAESVSNQHCRARERPRVAHSAICRDETTALGFAPRLWAALASPPRLRLLQYTVCWPRAGGSDPRWRRSSRRGSDAARRASERVEAGQPGAPRGAGRGAGWSFPQRNGAFLHHAAERGHHWLRSAVQCEARSTLQCRCGGSMPRINSSRSFANWVNLP